MDRFILHADHLDILWFWLKLPHVGHTCAWCPQGTLHSRNCWLRLFSSGLTTLIIQANLLYWIMLENSHLKLLLTIAYRLGLKLNILYPMFTPRTAWQRHLLSAYKDCSIVGHTYQAPNHCLGPCNIARSHVGPSEACCPNHITSFSWLPDTNLTYLICTFLIVWSMCRFRCLYVQK